MKRIYKISSILLAGAIVFLIFILPLKRNYDAHHVNIHGIYLLKPLAIHQLELIDQNGQPFTKNNLEHRWSLLFFGFTHCDMVCPVTLSALNQFYQNVEKKLSMKDRPQIVFITIDPERDSIKQLKIYLSQFNTNFIGARTSPEKIIDLKKQFHVLSEKIENTDQYNHSTDILLINPQAEIQAYFYFPHNPSQLEKDYLAILTYNHMI